MSLVFAGRRTIARQSCWNRALAQGTISLLAQGSVGHNGASDYFGEEPLADGTPRVDRIVAVVCDLIERHAQWPAGQ